MDSTVLIEIPTMCCIMPSTVRYFHQLMILRIESRISEVICTYSAYRSYLDRGHFGLNRCVACDRITDLRFLVVHIEPSAERITFFYCRQIVHSIRNSLEVRTFIGIHFT